MITLLALLPAFAGPQAWIVVGAPARAPLEVHTAPEAAAPVLAQLPAGTAGLVELEARPDGWLKVRSGTTEGWVLAAGLEPARPEALPAALTCKGTEPFWSIALKDGTASAATPDRPDAPTVDVSVTATAHQDAFLVTPKGKGPGFRWLVVRPEACHDGMSEVTYPWSAVALTATPGFVTGCCRGGD